MTDMSYTLTHIRKLMFSRRAAVLLAAAVIVSAYSASHNNSISAATPNNSAKLFDDFSSDTIDRTKWANTGAVRRLENGKFVSAITRFGSNDDDTLNFADARKISDFKADVTVTEVENVNAWLNARLVGAFYNEGTPGSGMAGDVLAGVAIGHNGTELVGSSFVAVCITDACNGPGEYDVIHFDRSFGPVALNETHTLSIDFDGKKFIFGFDGRTLEVDSTSNAPVAGSPHSVYKGIGTRIGGIDGPDEGGFIAATFDNVEVIIAPLVVGIVSGPSIESFASPIGEWSDRYQSTDGTWWRSTTTFIDEATATYTNSDGRVFFYETDDQNWEGLWVEDGRGVCSEKKHGSKNWGVIKFQFNEAYNKYEGTWDNCGNGQKFPFSGVRS
jgi:hypothetical protein